MSRYKRDLHKAMPIQRDPEDSEKKFLHKFADLKDKRILEVGSGEGRVTWKYANASKSIVGFDIDKDAIRVAQADAVINASQHVLFFNASAKHIPLKKETFDIAICSWSLCCIDDEDKLDALNEIHRVLVPNGIMIDLRSIMDSWEIEVVSLREIRKTGRVNDIPDGLEHDAGANRAIEQASVNGWFSRNREEFFSYYYSWDTPNEMEESIKEDWDDFITLDEQTLKSTRSAWTMADADSRVRLKVKVLISQWKVIK
jgi:ubiquinone/menaquinone biosynthesis C-methylase UbiE